MLSGGPISWSSKKQKCVALSTAEAKYVALSAWGCPRMLVVETIGTRIRMPS